MKTAREAFEAGQTYTPRIYGIGSRALEPCEEGAEISEDGKELLLIKYMPAGHDEYGTPYGTRKCILARKKVA